MNRAARLNSRRMFHPTDATMMNSDSTIPTSAPKLGRLLRSVEEGHLCIANRRVPAVEHAVDDDVPRAYR